MTESQLVGFVCATCTASSTLTHDSMSTHVKGAPYVAIHSVCVAKERRRQGVALALLRKYVERLANVDGVKGARLIAHDNLIPLYTKCVTFYTSSSGSVWLICGLCRAGFKLVGPSQVVHGALPWFEMALDLPSSPSEKSSMVSEKPAPARRNPGEAHELVASTSTLYDPTTMLNKADLFCPRAECRCLILKAGTAKYVKPRTIEPFKVCALG